jgi:excinuclease UvrABC ATPase subunit
MITHNVVDKNPDQTSYVEDENAFNVQACEKCGGAGKVLVKKKHHPRSRVAGTMDVLETCGTCGGNGLMKWKIVYHYERFDQAEVVRPDMPPIGATGYPGDGLGLRDS